MCPPAGKKAQALPFPAIKSFFHEKGRCQRAPSVFLLPGYYNANIPILQYPNFIFSEKCFEYFFHIVHVAGLLYFFTKKQIHTAYFLPVQIIIRGPGFTAFLHRGICALLQVNFLLHIIKSLPFVSR